MKKYVTHKSIHYVLVGEILWVHMVQHPDKEYDVIVLIQLIQHLIMDVMMDLKNVHVMVYMLNNHQIQLKKHKLKLYLEYVFVHHKIKDAYLQSQTTVRRRLLHAKSGGGKSRNRDNGWRFGNCDCNGGLYQIRFFL